MELALDYFKSFDAKLIMIVSTISALAFLAMSSDLAKDKKALKNKNKPPTKKVNPRKK